MQVPAGLAGFFLGSLSGARWIMNILVIMTGGTIGSAFDGTAINVRADGRCAVVDRYMPEHSDIKFDTVSPLNILSESVTCDDFNRLAQALYNADLSRYDGVILTVGSDNLGYLASFVGLLCGRSNVPVCLAAANLVLSDPASNGYDNFACAVELIRQGKAGVFVPYRNMDGVMYVHSATDIRQADLSEDFYSFHGAYAVFENGVFTERQPLIRHTLPVGFGKDGLPRIRDNVLLIHPCPMQDYSRFSADGAKAVLHTLYHSATLDAGAAVPFMQSLSDVPVFLASFRKGRKHYQTAEDMIAAGAIPLYDISPECAYIKLLFACAQADASAPFGGSIRAFMEAQE